MRVVLAQEDQSLRDYLRQVVLSLGLECDARDCVLYRELLMRLTQGEAPLVIVVIGREPQSALASIRQAANFGGLTVLATGPSQDPQLILQAIRTGAREFLDQKRLRDDLSTALAKLNQAGVVGFHPGRLISVVAAAPGTGVTTIASNLAFALGEKHPQRVALAELGLGVPELALALDLKPRHSIADLAQSWERLDATMLSQTLIEHPGGVHILAHQPETLAAPPLVSQAMQRTLLLLKVLYNYVVLDLGHLTDDSIVEALGLSEQVVLALRLDVPSLRLTRRLVHELGQRGLSPERVRLVANRYGQRKQVGWKEAEKAIGLPIVEYIPDDSTNLNAALNQGIPLLRLARRAGITRTFDKLASRLNGQA
jgi:pilus assembly protein CpaE